METIINTKLINEANHSVIVEKNEDTFIMIKGTLDHKFKADILRIKKELNEYFSIESFLHSLSS